MKPSATLYFIYCLVAKRWGRSVKINRDPLHSIYSVNRYGVTLTGISPDVIYYHLSHQLWLEGYTEEEEFYFTRIHSKVKTSIRFYLTKESVEISIYTYQQSKSTL